MVGDSYIRQAQFLLVGDSYIRQAQFVVVGDTVRVTLTGTVPSHRADAESVCGLMWVLRNSSFLVSTSTM